MAADPKLKPALAGLALFAALLPLFWWTDLDLWVSRLAFEPTGNLWPWQNAQPWRFLYLYGERPAQLLVALSVVALGMSYVDEKKRHWRRPAFYLVAVFILGPGLLVNGLGKGLLGRPRPWQTVEFGGSMPFFRPFQWGLPGVGKSFPSGHVSMAAYFFCLIFLLKGRARAWAWGLTLAFSALMCAARVLQGAHFLSDTVLCVVLMFTLAAWLSPLARQPSQA